MALGETHRRTASHHDVVKHSDVDESKSGLHRLRQDLVCARGLCTPAWVVVREDHRCGVRFDRAPHDLPRIHRRLCQRSAKGLLGNDEPALRVEVDGGEALVRLAGKRCYQKPFDLGRRIEQISIPQILGKPALMQLSCNEKRPERLVLLSLVREEGTQRPSIEGFRCALPDEKGEQRFVSHAFEVHGVPFLKSDRSSVFHFAAAIPSSHDVRTCLADMHECRAPARRLRYRDAMDDPRAISYFARTNARRPHRVFGIRQADRLFHLYAIGRTGTGKSTLIETLATGDINGDRGCTVIDPHGDTAARLASHMTRTRPDGIYWNVADPRSPYGYNPLRRVAVEKIPLAASGLLEAMKKLWADAWGVRMEHILRHALFALLEYGDATLPDVLTLCTDKRFRHFVLGRVENRQVRAFWKDEFPRLNPLYQKDAVAPIQNKIGAFLADPRLYRLFTAAPQQISFRRLMDRGTPLVVNLSRGELGDDSANLLGALIISTIGVAALSRAAVPEGQRRPHHFFIDEFQSFTTLAFADMISTLRKYGVSLTLTNQHLGQLEPGVRHSVLANVGTLIAFRVGPEDAPILTREFEPTFSTWDLVNLAAHDVIMKLMIDGTISKPFSATTLPPETPEQS